MKICTEQILLGPSGAAPFWEGLEKQENDRFKSFFNWASRNASLREVFMTLLLCSSCDCSLFYLFQKQIVKMRDGTCGGSGGRSGGEEFKVMRYIN
ncbi:hypothetical protein CDAR_225551 [Caerostris darwini]|uniref:Uncharacterized protein n=1 Tax=Caerostris darwini TaxID=1538125 RepID=A0AAV4R1D1_9ARAC|nr:hypothetical protein CDAR_225551 [Caerostris darwini]